MHGSRSILWPALIGALVLGACGDDTSGSFDGFNPWPTGDGGLTYDSYNYGDGSYSYDTSWSDACVLDDSGLCAMGPLTNPFLPRGMYRISLMSATITLQGQEVCGLGAYNCDPYVRVNFIDHYVDSSVRTKENNPYWAGEVLVSSISSEDLLKGFAVILMDDNPDAVGLDVPIGVCPGLFTEDTLRGRELRLQCGGYTSGSDSSAVVLLILDYLSAL